MIWEYKYVYICSDGKEFKKREDAQEYCEKKEKEQRDKKINNGVK